MVARWALPNVAWAFFDRAAGQGRERRHPPGRLPERLRQEIEAAAAGSITDVEQDARRADRMLDAVPPICLWRP
jgi:hypothetical protein